MSWPWTQLRKLPLQAARVIFMALPMATLSCAQSQPHPSPRQFRMIVFGTTMPSPWRTLNDGVMGGLSSGGVDLLDSSMVWVGETRLENNGGFASVRSPWGEFNLSDLDRIVVKCRGTGGPFKLTLETSERWWMPYAYASFEASADWQEVVIPASDLTWSQAQMGDLTSVRPKRDLDQVLRMGLMKYDGTAQSFELEVASLAFLPRQGWDSRP